ncbi:conserved hypothetical protein [Leishmania infantum JPCM5]|uniref:COPI_associated_protein_-_putative n=2 Tax=Leishmania infantum TaxID=5671 RepID=A0A6L0WPN4_LEIIN|nr:conserved hypothetical protein [Leishmania infantum JPCM5]CAC9442026.1 COPI_associated_protein_-_putative [Leishmania infantum]CAM65128.1 conserved hypothetical protein [Leishmania infantum JPCM5]SUZ38900.1 COPI_associated_protein_-_putative [Leishmania infantum]|eukprot:XP_001462942.1 conserved hypothetical protein [Leishmania infantum JPCM5]
MSRAHNGELRAPSRQSCCHRSWPVVFLIMSLIVVVLAFVCVILAFLHSIITPSIGFLGVYCLIFSLLGLSAEVLQFSSLNGLLFIWMKYFHVLLYYRPRGVFYILFGALLLGTSVIEIVAGTVAIALGALMLLVSMVAGMPEFEEAPEEEHHRRHGGRTSSAAARETSLGTRSSAKTKTSAAPTGSKSHREPNV